MDRKDINEIIKEGIKFIEKKGLINFLLRKSGYSMPDEAHWSLEKWHEEWLKNPDSLGNIAKEGLGWDITDFNLGNFYENGLLLYTLSNGVIGPDGQPVSQPYSNKIMVARENQVTPLHRHKRKIEDIACLEGNLMMKLYNLEEDDIDLDKDVYIERNGILRRYTPGEPIILTPGNRLRLEPRHWHTFCGYKGTALLEEASGVNDDRTDNVFLDKRVGRLPAINENEKPRFLLFTELPGTAKFDELVKTYTHGQK